MKGLKWVAVLTVIAALLSPLPLPAEEGAKSAQRMEAMVVSATRTEIPLFDAPQSVTVISSEEIMTSPFDRMEDIVRSIAGMHNFRHYALNTNGIVSPLQMRGVGKNRVLILVDSVPQNDNFNNAIAWVGWGHIPKETIERIEIVRGPNSAVYGSEGLGGVIHIITKKPKEQRQSSVSAQMGESAMLGGSGFHSQKIQNFGFMLSGGYQESDGFLMVREPKDYESKRYQKVGKILGKAVYDFGDTSELSFGVLYFNQEAGQGRQFFHNDLRLDQYWLNYSHIGDSFGVKGLVYLNRADKTAFQDTANDNYTSPFREEKFAGTQVWGADLQGTLLGWQPATINIGASFKEAGFEYDEDYPGSIRDAGAKGTQRFISPFANVDLNFFEERLLVNLGARYDWIDTSDGANWDTAASAGKPAYGNTFESKSTTSLSPKLGLVWHPDDKTSIRASAGKGFRAPSLFELYKVHVRGGGTYYRQANPNLKPEEIESYDVGVERFFTDSLWGRLTYYKSHATNYIGDRLTGQAKFGKGKNQKTRSEYKLDNISKVDISGVEAELEWYAFANLNLFANFTYNVSRVKKDENNPALEGNYLTNNPRHIFHGGLRYQNTKTVNVSLIANYYGDIYFDNENTLTDSGYFTVDASLSRRFFDCLSAHISVENIFDKQYPLFISPATGETIAPGVIVNGGVKVDF